MTKPDLPYSIEYKYNLERTAELYPPERRSFAMGGTSNVPYIVRDGNRPELTRGVNGK